MIKRACKQRLAEIRRERAEKEAAASKLDPATLSNVFESAYETLLPLIKGGKAVEDLTDEVLATLEAECATLPFSTLWRDETVKLSFGDVVPCAMGDGCYYIQEGLSRASKRQPVCRSRLNRTLVICDVCINVDEIRGHVTTEMVNQFGQYANERLATPKGE